LSTHSRFVAHEKASTTTVSWDTDDLDQPPEDALDILFPPAILPEGLARHNMCDAFVLLLEEEVNKQMLKFFGAKAR
jgi:hypothetical protein